MSNNVVLSYDEWMMIALEDSNEKLKRDFPRDVGIKGKQVIFDILDGLGKVKVKGEKTFLEALDDFFCDVMQEEDAEEFIESVLLEGSVDTNPFTDGEVQKKAVKLFWKNGRLVTSKDFRLAMAISWRRFGIMQENQLFLETLRSMRRPASQTKYFKAWEKYSHLFGGRIGELLKKEELIVDDFLFPVWVYYRSKQKEVY